MDHDDVSPPYARKAAPRVVWDTSPPAGAHAPHPNPVPLPVCLPNIVEGTDLFNQQFQSQYIKPLSTDDLIDEVRNRANIGTGSTLLAMVAERLSDQQGQIVNLAERALSSGRLAHDRSYHLSRAYCNNDGYETPYGWPTGDHTPETMADAIIDGRARLEAEVLSLTTAYEKLAKQEAHIAKALSSEKDVILDLTVQNEALHAKCRWLLFGD